MDHDGDCVRLIPPVLRILLVPYLKRPLSKKSVASSKIKCLALANWPKCFASAELPYFVTGNIITLYLLKSRQLGVIDCGLLIDCRRAQSAERIAQSEKAYEIWDVRCGIQDFELRNFELTADR